ncbi:hypothetical protein B0A48_14626 [Cryoendolithus antarcticus]|uniref:Sphingolipid long chain base-responsive protein LSP1 n=1 Tax=Cryoendolithus antarcticus TaxID=1507870 RepID=A0A1V8SL17_9PEZI|nr:hypothetical protein B0A48_14626 [Cryoendolithus antarcticus]
MTPSRLTTARHFDPDFEPRSRDLPGSAQPFDVASAASSVSATGDINIAFAYFVSQSIRKTYTKPSESHEAQLKVEQTAIMNVGRSLSIRSKKSDNTSSHASSGGAKHHFGLSSLRGVQQPELSKRLYKLIKSQNHAISAYDQAGKESAAIASQLSDWGESTEDESLSDISDKLGVLLAEIAEQEDLFAQGLEESRGVLKQIRNTESSVQPSRTHKQKIQDEIQKLKYKEPESTKLVTLEQELVRAEAQSLVAEAQLTNITRQKFKEAYDVHTAAVIERAEKQILLAQQARRLVNLLDDTPIVPGEERPAYTAGEQAREVLNDAETGLRGWQARNDPVHSQAGRMGVNAMPGHQEGGVQNVAPPQTEHLSNEQRVEAMERAQEQAPSAPYPVAEEERVATAV